MLCSFSKMIDVSGTSVLREVPASLERLWASAARDTQRLRA
jgi:hypothetical protein